MDIYKSYGIDIQIYNQRPVMDGEAGGASHQRLLRGRDPVLEKGEESFGGKMISNNISWKGHLSRGRRGPENINLTRLSLLRQFHIYLIAWTNNSRSYLVRAMCAVNCSAKSTPPITFYNCSHLKEFRFSVIKCFRKSLQWLENRILQTMT